MHTREELLQAKQSLSASLLRAGLRGNVVSTTAAVRVADAIAAAGQNVHAVGIGRKMVNGVETDDLCVRVYVVQKIAETLLPPIYRIPGSIDGITTDIIESPPAFIAQTKPKTKSRVNKIVAASTLPACSNSRRQNQRPLAAGISAGHFNITAGTIGYFCKSTRHGDNPADVFALSNNHVFADVNQARVGDDLYQPGPLDGGTATDHFADFTRCVTIELGGTAPNRVDAAIGRLRSTVQHRPEICSIGQITGSTRATEGMQVRKHGRTSGYTEGRVTDDSYDALVGMDHSNPSVVALFDNQMRIEAIAPYPAIGLGGDSGSLIVTKGGIFAVGLYFAGPASGSYGVANHIQDVLIELEIQLV